MAAPGPVGSRAAQREEPAGSAESSVATRTPVPTVSSVSPKQPVSPAQVAESPGKSLWEQICEEYEAELPPFPEGYKVQPDATTAAAPLEEMVFPRVKTAHVYSVPHSTRDSHTLCTPVTLETVDPKTCSPREFLETFIFPVLLPGMASLLHQAKKEKCFERKRTKFIACDFLTEWLYNPRPPVPLSLLLTEVEAVLRIQAFWRAYRVRCDAEIQELRQWQKKLREEQHIRQRVRIFWAKQEQKGRADRVYHVWSSPQPRGSESSPISATCRLRPLPPFEGSEGAVLSKQDGDFRKCPVGTPG
ncbi:PREDICTED: IQ domain-containing protein K isoform X2 [Hipposideros armiger]|uniref:IQ domain-containing protein K isoform X2 n=1 Tax=Hipposideros armiger TaxID=186990 RepID=A0A8B7T9R5_HIPAR|nr:PREDICTED: IQ domain-containing protein K isoform X2 [Hipposideros armiger]